MFGLIESHRFGKSWYENGAELISWEAGISSGDGSRSKEADHINLDTYQADSKTDWSYVTAVPIDLTRIRTLYIDWENIGTDIITNKAYFIAHTSSGGTLDDYSARLYKGGIFSRAIDSLDVSALTGSYYIRFHAADAYSSGARESNINVYRVWGVC